MGLHDKRVEGIYPISPIEDETSFLSDNQSWKKAAPLPERATKTLPLKTWILPPQYGITWIGNVPWRILSGGAFHEWKSDLNIEPWDNYS